MGWRHGASRYHRMSDAPRTAHAAEGAITVPGIISRPSCTACASADASGGSSSRLLIQLPLEVPPGDGRIFQSQPWRAGKSRD